MITGGTRGLGLAIAQALAPEFELLIGGRDPARTAQAAARFPAARPFACDLGDPEAVAEAVAGVDRVNVVVHSAGVAPRKNIEEVSAAEWVQVLNLNLVSVAELTRLLLPKLRESHGHVVMINAGLGLHAAAGWAPYSASKFGLRSFADTLRAEERGRIKVTSIHPGRIDTDMQRDLVAYEGGEYAAGRFLTPQTVALFVAQAVNAPADADVHEVVLRPR